MEYNFLDFFILVVAAFASGFVDAIAGGGGLIVLPALLFVGFPPLNLLATMKVQSCSGTAFSAVYFIEKGLINLKKHWFFSLFALINGFIGAKLVSVVPNHYLKLLIPILLLSVSIYVFLSPSINDTEKKAKLTSLGYILIVGSLIAMYDGFFGPGSGSLYIISLISLLGMSASKASATAKLLNLSSSIGSLSFFIFSGHVIWKFALAMALFNILGNFSGSRLVFSKGTKVVKPFLLIISLSVCVKTVFDLIRS